MECTIAIPIKTCKLTYAFPKYFSFPSAAALIPIARVQLRKLQLSYDRTRNQMSKQKTTATLVNDHPTNLEQEAFKLVKSRWQ